MSIASNGEMQVNDFNGVNNSTAYIENCYALADAVQNTYDYKEKKDANWKGRVELSYANKGGGVGRISPTTGDPLYHLRADAGQIEGLA